MAGILNNKFYSEDSAFKPEGLLRESRRQKGLPDCRVPSICLLDPDGDILDYLTKRQKANLNNCGACYHTKLYNFSIRGIEIGIVASAVGASFAVLIAEQLFVSGCKMLLSVTSSGVINEADAGIQYILIKEALRDEGQATIIFLLRRMLPLIRNCFRSRKKDCFQRIVLSGKE